MCDFCTQHGDGKIWYKNAANYSQDLLSDVTRRLFIEQFLSATINDGFQTLGRLEALYRRKGRLPEAVVRGMEDRAKTEHFGQVLPLEEIRELVLKAEHIVRMPCACRWTAEKKEVRCCYGISYGAAPWYRGLDMSSFGLEKHEGLESVQKEEALAQMEAMEDGGAIHTIWTMVTPFIGAVCNCSAGDCIALRTLSGIRVQTLARAEHVAVVDSAVCIGCGLCEERCQFGAITGRRESGIAGAAIDGPRCYGCGLCRRACERGAISMRLR